MRWPTFLTDDNGANEFIEVHRVRGGKYEIVLDAPTWHSRQKTAQALNALGLSLQRVAFELITEEETDGKSSQE